MIKKEELYELILRIPIYPRTVLPREIGMKDCNLPSSILLGEDDKGFIFFNSEKDKNNALEVLSNENS